MTTYSAASLFKTRSRIAQIVPNDCWDQILSLTNVFTNNSEKLADLLLGITKSDILQGQALLRRVIENVDLLSMFDNLQKISLLSVESLFFSKELLLFLKHLEKVTLVLTPSPLLKCHSYSHIPNLIFF